MKQDWKEAFRYYKNMIDFPHADKKAWVEFYQKECVFHNEDIKTRELTLIERIIKWVKEIKIGRN